MTNQCKNQLQDQMEQSLKKAIMHYFSNVLLEKNMLTQESFLKIERLVESSEV